MSASNEAIKERMRQAGIPPNTFKTTLAREGQNTLSHLIKHGDFIVNGETRSFLVDHNGHGPRRSAQIAAIAGKELVLMGQRVRYLPLAGILRELRLSEVPNNSDEINFTKRGDGFIVVPDLDNQNSIPREWEFASAQAWLLEHVARGGGLVVAASPRYMETEEMLTPAFASLVEGFMICKVELSNV